jgi:hypothetical protein
MPRRLLVCVTTVGALLLSATGSADAGGWWSIIDLESRYLVVGRTVQAHSTDVLFSSVDQAEEARDQMHFYAYLVRGYEFSALERAMRKAEPRHWWKLGNSDLTLLGEVSLSISTDNLATATTRFVVPDVSLGPYALMFCDAGCVEPLADIIPLAVTLVADPQTARLAERVDRLEDRLARVKEQTAAHISAAEAAAHLATVQAGYATEAARDLNSTIDTLRSDLQRMAQAATADDRAPAVPWTAFLGWFLGGATVTVLVLALIRQRNTRARVDPRELERLMDDRDLALTARRG